jgi:hypothetical protein
MLGVEKPADEDQSSDETEMGSDQGPERLGVAEQLEALLQGMLRYIH